MRKPDRIPQDRPTLKVSERWITNFFISPQPFVQKKTKGFLRCIVRKELSPLWQIERISERVHEDFTDISYIIYHSTGDRRFPEGNDYLWAMRLVFISVLDR